MTLVDFIRIGGVLQLGLLIASALVPKVLDWRGQLKSLDPLVRKLIWVHGIYVVMMIIFLGLTCLLAAEELASGTLLARALCGFTAVCWLLRLVIQLAVFDAKPYLKTTVLRLGFHGLTAIFCYLSAVFTYAALR